MKCGFIHGPAARFPLIEKRMCGHRASPQLADASCVLAHRATPRMQLSAQLRDLQQPRQICVHLDLRDLLYPVEMGHAVRADSSRVL